MVTTSLMGPELRFSFLPVNNIYLFSQKLYVRSKAHIAFIYLPKTL